MERKINFAAGEYYHIYNRGVDKRKIFLDELDRRRFLRLIYVCNGSKPVDFSEIKDKLLIEINRGETLVHLGSYCLMPNHFHFLLREKTNGNVSKFFSKLLTAYSMYFNKRYKRRGRLFESNFQAQHVSGDEYLRYLFAYIHLNPVKLIEPDWKLEGIQKLSDAKNWLLNYNFSSYLDYLESDREEKVLLNRSEFPVYFSGKKEFEDYLNDWLTWSKFY